MKLGAILVAAVAAVGVLVVAPKLFAGQSLPDEFRIVNPQTKASVTLHFQQVGAGKGYVPVDRKLTLPADTKISIAGHAFQWFPGLGAFVEVPT